MIRTQEEQEREHAEGVVAEEVQGGGAASVGVCVCMCVYCDK